MSEVERIPLIKPLASYQMTAASLLAGHYDYKEAARLMGVGYPTMQNYIALAAAHIPGDLPTGAKVVAWWRGASHAVLGALEPEPRQVRLTRAYEISRLQVCLHCGHPHGHADNPTAGSGHQ